MYLKDLALRLRNRAIEHMQETADRENVCEACCGSIGTNKASDYNDLPEVLLMLEAAEVLEAIK